MQNTVNLLDGVDGLAAGVVAIVALLLVVAAVSRPDPSVSSSWEAGSSESPMPVWGSTLNDWPVQPRWLIQLRVTAAAGGCRPPSVRKVTCWFICIPCDLSNS